MKERKPMPAFESKLLDVFENHYLWLFITLGLILSFVIRFAGFGFISSDMEGFLLGWYGQIEQLGRFKALDTQVGNYAVIYQTLIAVMTYLPIPPVVAYKLLSVIFDYSLAAAAAFLLYELSGHRKALSVGVFFAVIFTPQVFFNSAIWGQCDSIYTSFALWSLYAFARKKYPKAFVLYGLSCAFKLQAVFLLPFYLFAYIRKKDFSVFHFLIVPAVMEIVTIPAMIMGRGWKAAFSVYYYQTFSCDKMYFSFPGFWSVFSNLTDRDRSLAMIDSMKLPAICLAVAALAALMAVFILLRKELTAKNELYLAFLFAYTCVMFLPGMHERYGFLYEIAAIVIAFILPKTLPLLFGVLSLSFLTYGSELFGSIDVNPLMGLLNLAVYFLYIYVLFQEMTKASEDR